MIRQRKDCEVDIRERMRDGNGTVRIEKLWAPEKELKSKTRLFARLVIEPGSSIGFHKHENEEEIYVVLKGRALIDDDGRLVRLGPGDSSLTGGGAGHSISCDGDEPLEVIAVISSF